MHEEPTAPDMIEEGAGTTGNQGEEGVTPGSDSGCGVVASEKVPDSLEEQLLYAKILEIGMFVGLGLLLVTFSLYVIRILPATIPIEQLTDYWTMNVNDFLEALNEHYLHQEHLMTGWSWTSQIMKGDYLNFVPIVILSAITIICYLGITPVFIRKKDRAYMFMALLEVMILTLAASGILTVGH